MSDLVRDVLIWGGGFVVGLGIGFLWGQLRAYR